MLDLFLENRHGKCQEFAGIDYFHELSTFDVLELQVRHHAQNVRRVREVTTKPSCLNVCRMVSEKQAVENVMNSTESVVFMSSQLWPLSSYRYVQVLKMSARQCTLLGKQPVRIFWHCFGKKHQGKFYDFTEIRFFHELKTTAVLELQIRDRAQNVR